MISRTRAGDMSTLSRQLLDGGLALELLDHLALDPVHLVDRLDHVHRDADGAGLVGDGPGDGLADPPGGVGGELEPLGPVELLDGPHQAEVPLLDEVEDLHAPAHVALGDRHDQPEVRLGELGLGVLALAGQPGEPTPLVEVERLELAAGRQVGEALGGLGAPLDLLGEGDLLLGGQQRDPADLLEVHPHRVRRAGGLGAEPERVAGRRGPEAGPVAALRPGRPRRRRRRATGRGRRPRPARGAPGAVRASSLRAAGVGHALVEG